jgi:D-alanyl-D-alanine carboxypeptidase
VQAFGVQDPDTGEAMTPDLFMRIGSNTKSFTTTAILQLVDQGLVGLDDPIEKYVSGVPNGDQITIRQLGMMRSGLFDYSVVTVSQRAEGKLSISATQLARTGVTSVCPWVNPLVGW